MSRWRDLAACVGQSALFYPAERDFASVREAKAICRECPVTAECLEHAIESGEVYGIWGGMGPKERRMLTSRRWHG